MVVHGKYFYGNEISEYGQQNGYVDYGTLAKSFDAVLNNEIIQKTYDIGYWEQESGFVDHTEEIESLKEKIEEYKEEIARVMEDDDEYEENHIYIAMNENIERLEAEIEELENEENEYYPECYQYYIVSDNGARILEEINEIVYYNEELDMYVWGVTHFGTSWSYVLTDIKCNVPYEDEK